MLGRSFIEIKIGWGNGDIMKGASHDASLLC